MLGVSGGDAAVAETYRLLEERAGDALEGVLVERDGRRRPGVTGGPETRPGVRTGGRLRPGWSLDRGAGRRRPWPSSPWSEARRGGASRPDPRRPSCWAPSGARRRWTGRTRATRSRRSPASRWTSPRSPRSTSTLCWSRAPGRWRPTLSSSCRRKPATRRVRAEPSFPTYGRSSPRIRSPSSGPLTTSASGAARPSATCSTAATRARSTR